MIIGVVDDGAPEMKAAMEGVRRAGSQVVVVPYTGDAVRAQGAYKDGGCLAVIVKDVKQLKNLMDTGAGLECEGCSAVGSPTSPPRWIIVMNSEGKTSDQLEKEGGTTGKICDELPDGKKFCLQVAPPFNALNHSCTRQTCMSA
jgi:hypothetical protein